MDVSDETVGCLASTGALGLLIVAFLHGPACGFLFLGFVALLLFAMFVVAV